MASKFLKVLVPRALGVVDCGEGCEALSKRVLPARTLGILENPFVRSSLSTLKEDGKGGCRIFPLNNEGVLNALQAHRCRVSTVERIVLPSAGAPKCCRFELFRSRPTTRASAQNGCRVCGV